MNIVMQAHHLYPKMRSKFFQVILRIVYGKVLFLNEIHLPEAFWVWLDEKDDL
jgi:hypothetical protein